MREEERGLMVKKKKRDLHTQRKEWGMQGGGYSGVVACFGGTALNRVWVIATLAPASRR
jgi:hypothetical protein